jgi:hypothetical protein
VDNSVFSTLEFHAHWFHEPLASFLAIARIHVNMLAPKTLRTVVGVAASVHKATTPFTDEVFPGALELSCFHYSQLSFFCFCFKRFYLKTFL